MLYVYGLDPNELLDLILKEYNLPYYRPTTVYDVLAILDTRLIQTPVP
jgi:uncharacterized protein (UPF0147 family)